MSSGKGRLLENSVFRLKGIQSAAPMRGQARMSPDQ